ncbi:hypothetical protein [Fredinandcohnia sp. 179-A 10B2 NHS]|uniref:hypothetical protein n=1 Tax=Fredinandcohnia sp. 179-A 10B2 NHS TaxID=3235176 RepID=UPI00399FCEC0
MNTKKIIVALAIFTFMFIGVWWLNEQTKREYIGEKPRHEDKPYQIQTIDTKETEEVIVFPKFKPREYIRIDGR